jgi:ribosome-associated protein
MSVQIDFPYSNHRFEYRKDVFMHQIKLREEYIKLGQALKAAGLVDSGVEAKEEILDGNVKVNGTVEIQRGKKLHDGDIVDYNGEQIQVIK